MEIGGGTPSIHPRDRGRAPHPEGGLLQHPLVYRRDAQSMMPFSFANFEIQIPADGALQGISVFAQTADLETGLPVVSRTNRAGLVTSNGIEMRLSSVPPSLGMAIVRSHLVDASETMPTSGKVDVERAPVMRLTYQ